MLIVFKGLYFEEAQRCPKTLLASDLQKHQCRWKPGIKPV